MTTDASQPETAAEAARRRRREELMALKPSLPTRPLRTVLNATRFRHFSADKMGPGRRFFDVVVVKGSFALTEGLLQPLDEHAAITFADRYLRPELTSRTSIERAGDLVLYKPSTDVLVTGHARASGGRPQERWSTGVVVQDRGRTLASLALEATGPRRWEHRAVRGWTLSDPEPAVEVPLRYELAYGGARAHPREPDRWVCYEPNPSGSGFELDDLDRSVAHPGPQWAFAGEPAGAPSAAKAPAGFGPVSRAWASRLRYVGTYDAAWRRRTLEEAEAGLPPDYAADFDLRFFQCAHPALITPVHLRGDEQVGLQGLTGADMTALRLPGLGVRARTLGASGEGARDLPLDTVHVDLDAQSVHLVWRLCLDQAEQVETVLLEELDGSERRRGGLE